MGLKLPEFKEMPYSEKLGGILVYTKISEDFAQKLVMEEFGKEKLSELRSLWTQGIEPIPEGAPDKDKYEIAYRNFMRKWVYANNFFSVREGDVGATKYMHAAIEAWKRKYALDAFVLKIVGGFSRKAAFGRLTGRLAYQLQMFSPFTVTEFKDNRMVLSVTPCKILKDKNGARFCTMACQNIIPSWLEAQFNIKMRLNRQGDNCNVVFEPF